MDRVDIRALGHNRLYRLSGGGERGWCRRSQLQLRGQRTLQAVKQMNWRWRGPETYQRVTTTKGRGHIHQVKCQKQQQPKHSGGGKAGRPVRSSAMRAETTYSNVRSSSQSSSSSGSSSRNFRQNRTWGGLGSSSSSDNELEQQQNSVHLGWYALER